ncbi:YdaU family protein [Sphingobium sp. CFD-2]|uniref:YdaU family protein n=1 Tax=Sphingobium sp. CFD-2 TaxID=2878542 RepID=UPI00214C957E|nr:YdaU family protein [Sphingobium sp. CFD-2]
MTDLPQPLTPAECDLQDFPFMPLHVARLRDSDLAAEESAEALGYALLLWCASWHQLPAGSLPDNEAVLTRLVNLGKDVRTFRKVRAAAMRGFVLCSDGRWYHPVVAEQVVAAWESKQKQRHRTFCATIRKHNERHPDDLRDTPAFDVWMSLGCPERISEAVTQMSRVTGDNVTRETPSKREGQGQGQGQGDSNIDEDERAGVKPDSVEEVARLVGNAAGVNHNPANDQSRYADNLAHVRDWVALGATVDLMVEVARKACEAQSQPIRSFRYLDAPIRQAVAKRSGQAAGKPKGEKVKPLASGGSLFQRLQAGEISQEEFDRERAAMLAAERAPSRRERTHAGPIGDLVGRLAGGRA